MTLLDSLFRRGAGARPVGAGAGEMTGEQAQEARVRARRRLIGAMVLLGIGVIAFPLLFETQPRPIPVDIPIVIPPRDGAPPLALPAPRSAPKPAASAPAVAAAPSGAVTVAAAPAPAAPASASTVPPMPSTAPPRPEPVPAKPEAAKPTPKPEAKPAPKVEAEPAPKPATPVAAASSARFVVQIGAFAEAAAVRETRAKAQKAGVSTYTQVVETSGGKRTRVRVGPFNTREDAEKAAEKVKAAGLPVSVVPL